MSKPSYFNFEVLVTVLIVVAGILNAVQMNTTVAAEKERPAPHWDAPGFEDAALVIGDAKEVVFVTDELGRPTANGRIHSCQFAIIPANLIVKHTRLEVLAAFEKGTWCIIDAVLPASVDRTEQEVRQWATDKKRVVVFQRLSPRLALFRALDEENGDDH